MCSFTAYSGKPWTKPVRDLIPKCIWIHPNTSEYCDLCHCYSFSAGHQDPVMNPWLTCHMDMVRSICCHAHSPTISRSLPDSGTAQRTLKHSFSCLKILLVFSKTFSVYFFFQICTFAFAFSATALLLVWRRSDAPWGGWTAGWRRARNPPGALAAELKAFTTWLQLKLLGSVESKVSSC